MQTITIAVSAILIAAGLVTAPGLINNARDNNARTDLDNIAFSQEFALGSSGEYFTLDAEGQPDVTPPLENIRYSLSGSTSNHLALVCDTPSPAYLLRATSASERTFYRASGAALTSDDLADLTYPQCIQDQIDAYDIANPGDPFVVAGPGGGGPAPGLPVPTQVNLLGGGGGSANIDYPIVIGGDFFGGGSVDNALALPIASSGDGFYPITAATAWINGTQRSVNVGTSMIEIYGSGTQFTLMLGTNADFYVGDGRNSTMRSFVTNGVLSFTANGITSNNVRFSNMSGYTVFNDADVDRIWEPIMEIGDFQNTYNCGVAIDTSSYGPNSVGNNPGARRSYLPSMPVFGLWPDNTPYDEHYANWPAPGDGIEWELVLNDNTVISDSGNENSYIYFEINDEGFVYQFSANLHTDDDTQCAGVDDGFGYIDEALMEGAELTITVDGTVNQMVLTSTAQGWISDWP